MLLEKPSATALNHVMERPEEIPGTLPNRYQRSRQLVPHILHPRGNSSTHTRAPTNTGVRVWIIRLIPLNNRVRNNRRLTQSRVNLTNRQITVTTSRNIPRIYVRNR